MASGGPALVASGSPALVASGSPALVASGGPALVASSSPALVASGSPALVASGSPALAASGGPALVASGSHALVASGSPARNSQQAAHGDGHHLTSAPAWISRSATSSLPCPTPPKSHTAASQPAPLTFAPDRPARILSPLTGL